MSSPLAEAVPAALPSPAPAGGRGWLGMAEAARRSGRSVGHLTRQCRSAWLAKGLARQAKRGPGKPVWEVHETADPALAPVKFPEQIGQDLTHLSDRQRALVDLRKTILVKWEESCAAAVKLGFGRDSGTGQFLQRLYLGEILDDRRSVKLCRATLYGWMERYRQGGPAALADGRAGGQPAAGDDAAGSPAAPAADPFMECVRTLYLTPRKPTLAFCFKYACIEAERQPGWTVRGYKACQRMIGRIPGQVLVRMRDGEKAFVDRCEPAIKRDYTALATNEVWCGDHHRLDVIAVVPDGKGGTKYERPWLTAWQDLRSRKIVGWTLYAGHDPNAEEILTAFTAAARGCGLPDQVMVDNGKDYDAKSLHGRTKRQRRRKEEGDLQIGAFRLLAVGTMNVWPYHGQSKPIERFFGSAADRFARLFETYCGGSTADKPHDEISGQYLARQVGAGKAPTVEELRRAFGEWLLADYHHLPHLGDGMLGRTPEQVYQECGGIRRAIEPKRLTFACMPRVGPVKVGKQGVTYKGMHFGGFDAEVQRLWGKRVYLSIDTADLSRVLVLDLDGSLLCEAKGNLTLPVRAGDQELREAIRTKKQLRKLRQQYAQQRPRMPLDVQQLVADVAATKAAAAAGKGGGDEPPPMPIRAAVDRPLKLAVGSELGDAGEPDAQPPAAFPPRGRFVYHAAAAEEEDLEPAAAPSFRELMARRATAEEGDSDE
jgi:transposase InsO family protein